MEAKSKQLKEWQDYDPLLQESLEYSTSDLKNDYYLMLATFGENDSTVKAYKLEIELRGETV